MNDVTINDPWTLELEALLLEIAAAAEEHAKPYYLGGGVALDVSLGWMTRHHEDLDFYPFAQDADWWKDWFAARGYAIVRTPGMADFPNAFAPFNE